MTWTRSTHCRTDLDERFWSKVDIGEWQDCWLWTAGTVEGYGRFTVGSRTDGTMRGVGAHRVAYELLVGPVPNGLELDHVRSWGWKRSSKCSADKETGNCVEVAVATDGLVLLRDSRQPDTVLRLDPGDWQAFVAGVAVGDFADLPVIDIEVTL